jgi:two-component system cell cycle sensor histidine kinase/response regulator CckA
LLTGIKYLIQFDSFTEEEMSETERSLLPQGTTQLSERLEHNKQEILGRLAAGVAHDTNNLLTVIGGYAQFAINSVPTNNPLYPVIAPMLQEIITATEQCAALNRQLTSFARKRDTKPQIVSLNQTVAVSEKMLHQILGERIRLVIELDEDPCHIEIDPTQLGQTILNLAVNASDAMINGGRLTIKTQLTTLRTPQQGIYVMVPAGSYVTLSVSDTGCGIAEEAKARIFEPYFTTKQDKGTGLGLATVYGIVKENSGHLQVESQVGKGTSFTIYFPSTDKKTSNEFISKGAELVHVGKGTVLVVDDTEEVLRVCQESLERRGYRVLVANAPSEALYQFMTQGKIDLLLTDIGMQEMYGHELAAKLLTFYPNLKVLYMSAYLVLEPEVEAVVKDHFLQKPFLPQKLVEKVQEELAR